MSVLLFVFTLTKIKIWLDGLAVRSAGQILVVEVQAIIIQV